MAVLFKLHFLVCSLRSVSKQFCFYTVAALSKARNSHFHEGALNPTFIISYIFFWAVPTYCQDNEPI